MEGWWTEGVGWGQAGVKFCIDGHALEGSSDSFVEESKEDTADEGGENEYDQESTPRIFESHIWSNEEEDEALENEDEEISHKNEPGGEWLSKVELDHVFQVENEAVPGTGAEWSTSDSHIGVGDGVDVLNKVFQALEAAFSTCGCRVWLSFLLTASSFTKNLQNLDDSHEKRTKSHRTGMGDTGPVEWLGNLCFSFTIWVGVEVVSGNTAHACHDSLVLQVVVEPEECKQ